MIFFSLPEDESWDNITQHSCLAIAVIRPYTAYEIDSIIKIHSFKRALIVLVTIILPVVLYGCETWCLTLREEHRLRVFENRLLRRISARKRRFEKSAQ
jgi:hypothetical protein